MTPRLYIAGPMTGWPDNNYPAFHSAAKTLRSIGYEVINPAENEAPVRADGKPPAWQDWMRLSVKQVADADGIALLDGWARSRGASVEYRLAHDLGIHCASYSEWQLTWRRLT